MENKLEYTDDLFVRTNKKYKEEVSVARHSVWRDIKKELLSNKIAVFAEPTITHYFNNESKYTSYRTEKNNAFSLQSGLCMNF